MIMELRERVVKTILKRNLAEDKTPVLAMISGGSDSTALAYLLADLQGEGLFGPLGLLHVNHGLRGDEADADERFVRELAAALSLPLTVENVDVAEVCRKENGNLEAVARRVRYEAASHALAALCQQAAVPVSEGRIFVAHTADDRVENFYMRSIVGTGPGGFRSMRYLNGQVGRPLLDIGRETLRNGIQSRAQEGLPVVRDDWGALWCEDATNAHTDRFRAYVRHEIIPLAKEKNPKLLQTLVRTMNAIADEDDMLNSMAQALVDRHVRWLMPEQEGCVISPIVGAQPVPLQRRVMVKVLEALLDNDARIESASVEALLAGFDDGAMNSGYVNNIQGNLAVSANSKGLRIEPMAAFRTRRNML